MGIEVINGDGLFGSTVMNGEDNVNREEKGRRGTLIVWLSFMVFLIDFSYPFLWYSTFMCSLCVFF